MPEIFSNEWSETFKDLWNSDEELTSSLQRAGFCSVVAFGFPDSEHPDFIMTIDNGRVISTNDGNFDAIKWDIRATKDNWLSLVVKPPGLMKLGIAYTSRKLRFATGDYATMIKDPSLAGAFVKSFALMGKAL